MEILNPYTTLILVRNFELDLPGLYRLTFDTLQQSYPTQLGDNRAVHWGESPLFSLFSSTPTM